MNLVSAASHLRIHSINAANLGGRGHRVESQCPAVTRGVHWCDLVDSGYPKGLEHAR